MTYKRLLGISAPVAISLCSALYAQQTTGGVSGLVTDASGGGVANVPVTLSSSATGFTRTVTSNGNGEYAIPDVEPGVYKVSVNAPNFKAFVANSVQVNVATTNTVNAQLQIGDTSETVTVEDTNVTVQTDTAALGQVIDGNQVKELPLNGRSFVELTQLQPGVSAANNFDTKNKGLQGGVDMSVNGNPTTNNLFLIDGVNNNDTGSNRTILIYPSNEAIAEFKMLTNSYGAEYGQASGAVISIVTRSGTNRFHGSAFYDGRNDVLNASPTSLAKMRTPHSPAAVKISFGETTLAIPSAARLKKTSSSSSSAKSGTEKFVAAQLMLAFQQPLNSRVISQLHRAEIPQLLLILRIFPSSIRQVGIP